MITPATKPLEVNYTAKWRVFLPLHVYREMMFYVDKFPGECSGCGLVEHRLHEGEHQFVVTEVFLPDQRNTGSSTDIEEDKIAPIVTRLVREGKQPEQLRFHWHSHAGMAVFHSGTDEDNYKTLQTGEWLVSLVLNKAGDMLGRIDYYQPFGLKVVNVPVTVLMADSIQPPEWQANLDRVKAFEATPRVYQSAWQKRFDASKLKDDEEELYYGYRDKQGVYHPYAHNEERYEKRSKRLSKKEEVVVPQDVLSEELGSVEAHFEDMLAAMGMQPTEITRVVENKNGVTMTAQAIGSGLVASKLFSISTNIRYLREAEAEDYVGIC